MQTSLLNRFLLVMLPSAVLLVLAAAGLIDRPAHDELPRAVIALTALSYCAGMLAMLWALQPVLKRRASGAAAVTDALP